MKFPELVRVARDVVRAAQKRLPPEIRPLAVALPVSYKDWPSDEILGDDLEDDILGLFVGHPHGGELAVSDPLPPQILLFLENIWDYAEDDPGVYRDEVRITYYHELGHYLGWDEDELARRGLD
jgi:predicted Zn-dependent protease with MMP-like domain